MCEEEQALQLTYALAKQVPAMASGFNIHTSYGDIEIDGEDAQHIASAVRAVLERKLKRLKRQ